MNTDWQTLATIAIAVAAAVYLARRWWPGIRGFFAPAGSASSGGAAACGQASAPSTLSSGGSSSCGQGCGHCGPQATGQAPHKDHRPGLIPARPVHWAKTSTTPQTPQTRNTHPRA